ncbi:EamA family transporter, partial [Lysinibacillus sp. fls2-241-R2A-57]|uniref:EamA family transporter n=1 Tax=Lysinibacillus sp. fls2-241-R2A-57 TaxID=3040292 RepID=UPI002557817C
MELKIDKSIYKVGIYALLGSAVLTSVSQVFYANQVQAVHPFLFTGISFFITALYFQIFASKQKTKVNWKEDKKPLLKLNIASAITFMGFYFALKYVEPAIVSSLEMGIAPLFILILMVLQRKTISFLNCNIKLNTFFKNISEVP